MAYSLLLYWTPGTEPKDGSDALEAEYRAWEKLTRKMRKAGVLIAREAVQAPENAVTLHARTGGMDRVAGPVVASDRHLFAFYVLDVPDMAVAVEWAEQLPHLWYGWVEIRPSM